LRWRGEKAKSVPNLHYLLVTNLSIGTARNDLEKIAIRTYRRGRHMTQLQSRHVLHRNRVMRAIDLDFEVVLMLRVVFVTLFRVLVAPLFAVHGNPPVWCIGIKLPEQYGA